MPNGGRAMDTGIGSCAEDLLMLLMFGYEVRGELVGKDVAVDCLCAKVECAAAQCTVRDAFSAKLSRRRPQRILCIA